ncbi:hypothetical protein FA95DRAFT_1613809 [Auriscalpium vulgare]|uniref:Uncharacterized protein n=1 Tax=Auriscalpium vulgare TaxID=40419 RepID=A0ACB8R1K7_9AGAM|nr:hypothetical protein FA95DRAFT_1613809 [Auriscalpium vulgare]
MGEGDGSHSPRQGELSHPGRDATPAAPTRASPPATAHLAPAVDEDLAQREPALYATSLLDGQLKRFYPVPTSTARNSTAYARKSITAALPAYELCGVGEENGKPCGTSPEGHPAPTSDARDTPHHWTTRHKFKIPALGIFGAESASESHKRKTG